MEEPVHSGKVLGGRYTLGARLGAGGWGSVYAAVQSDLGRHVAIKVLHTSVALSSDGLARFEREARAAAALGHPNIAQVSDFQANVGEPPFLVMELLTGGTLGAALKAAPGRKIAPSRMAWIAYQILAGLDVAHRAGIVHRDIKPDNVFLVAMAGVEDHVKLLDFGIAKLSHDTGAQLTASGTMLGSPAFMAPEQVRSSHFDHRVDLYAVGATMYLAMAGKMPFDASTVHGLLLAITEERPTPLAGLDPTIDPGLSAFVERAMHKDPDGRFVSAEEMRRAIEPWLGGMAAHASATANAPRLFAPASVATFALASPATIAAGAPPVASGPPLGSPPPGSPAAPGYAPSGAPMNPNQGALTNPQYGVVTSPQYGGAPPPQYGANPGSQPPPNASVPPFGAPMNPTYAASSNSQYGAAPPAPAKSSGAVVGLLVVAVGLLLVLVAGGAGAFYFYAGRGEGAASGSAASGGATSPAAASAVSAAGAAGGAASAANGAPPSGATSGGAVAAGAKARGAPAAGGAPAPAGAVTGAAAAVAASAAGPAAAPPGGAKKQFAGTTNWRIGGGSFDVFEIDPSKAAIMKLSGPITGCYAATEFDPPDHQFTDWTFQVDPAGNVKSVRRTTDFEPHPKFDVCMTGALRQVKWPATKAGGSPHVSFTARTRDNP